MEKLKHTPGPWTVDYSGNGIDKAPAIYGKNGGLVVSVLGLKVHNSSENLDTKFSEETMANAKLIASAPDLLEACKLLQKHANYILPEASASDRFETAHEVMMAVNDAVKKSTE